MAVGAFIQVQQSLRWFIDNFNTIADWRGTLVRVTGFRETVINLDRGETTESHIELVEASGNKVTFQNLEIAAPTGYNILSERHVEIILGDRVLIVGDSGTGKTLLFQAIAGLWPWGSGRVALPFSDGVMFIPRRPYVPLGTLRAAVAYPSPETAFKDDQLLAVLQSTGLDNLSSSLDQTARWDKELTDEEQQWLVFTRILLHKPRLIVIGEALDTLEADVRNRVISLFKDKLKDAGIINIGRLETNSFFTRVLHLVKDPQGRCFLPNLRVSYSPTYSPA